MFGYITASKDSLSPEALTRYRSCYCGLCRELQRRHGLRGRITLTYDMTFLVLVLSSLYEPEEQRGENVCPVHPLKKQSWWTSLFTRYAADLNVLLAWWDLLDDWEDEKKVSRLALYKLLSPDARELEKQYPRQSQVIRTCLKELHRYEAGPEVSADRAADCFGQLMGELFVYDEADYWAPVLRQLGQSLGRFIYIMDACLDYERDVKKGLPNPLTPLDHQRDPEGDRALLSMLLGEASEALEHLPMLQDMDILRNILYEGVWQRYEIDRLRREKRSRGRDEDASPKTDR